MNVSLTPELDRWVDERVSAGLYASASEVVREALRLLRDQDDLKRLRRAELQRAIQVGLDDANAGRTVDADDAVFDAIVARGRQRIAERAR